MIYAVVIIGFLLLRGVAATVNRPAPQQFVSPLARNQALIGGRPPSMTAVQAGDMQSEAGVLAQRTGALVNFQDVTTPVYQPPISNGLQPGVIRQLGGFVSVTDLAVPADPATAPSAQLMVPLPMQTPMDAQTAFLLSQGLPVQGGPSLARAGGIDQP
jgi:hypothetical protein